MKKQKVILFDIDFTLFDASCYRNKFLSAIKKEIGYSGDDFDAIAEAAYSHSRQATPYFDPDDFIRHLGKYIPITLPHEKLINIIFAEDNFEGCLYSDVMPVLKKLSKQKDIILGIFSAGKLDIQRPKIKTIKSLLHEKHIHIYEFQKAKALDDLMKEYKDKKIYMIDDIAEVLYKAKQVHKDITTILIKRKNTIRKDAVIANFHPDSIISTLEELVI